MNRRSDRAVSVSVVSAQEGPACDVSAAVPALDASACGVLASVPRAASASRRRVSAAVVAGLAAAALPGAAPAQAPLKLKWAHVYETPEPYHTQAVWAADEIRKRSNGRIDIQVFPSSQLGNENQINEALTLGTVDLIYTGVAFAGSLHKPLAITNAPFVLRDFEHWKLYRDSPLFRTIAGGYEKKTGHQVVALTYYGQRHVTANREIRKPEDMKGMKLRVPPAPLFLMFTKSVGANATPIAFAEVYLALQNNTVDGQENPLPTIMAKKFYEVQSHIALTGHITESLVTLVGGHVWSKLSEPERQMMRQVLKDAAERATDRIRASEQVMAEEFRKLGKKVIEPDRAAFRAVALPLHNDPAAGAGWTKAEYDALQALK